MGKAEWSVYIVRCADQTLYTGISTDIPARLKTHNSGKGAAYTRPRRPVKLLYAESGLTRSQALIREAKLKSLPRAEKGRIALSQKLPAGLKRLLVAVGLMWLAAPTWAVPTFNTKEAGIILSSAVFQSVTGTYADPPSGLGPVGGIRAFYIRGSSEVFTARSVDGLAFTNEAGVRLSILTGPSLDIAISSITGVAVLPVSTGGFRMLYSVIGSTGAFRIYKAISADGLGWANEISTPTISIDDGKTFVGSPSLVNLGLGVWKLYFIRNSVFGNQAANHQIFSATSINEGATWALGPSVVAGPANEVASAILTNALVRLYYTSPLSGNTTSLQVLSSISSDATGASFSSENTVLLSTSAGIGTMIAPEVVRSTDGFRWRIYYNFRPFATPQLSTAAVFSAVTDSPDIQAFAPNSVFKSDPPVISNITGENFSTGVTVMLTAASQANIIGAGLARVDDQHITVTFDTQGKALGFWNLVVTNSNSLTATRNSALLIDFKGGSVHIIDNLIRPLRGEKTTITVTIFNDGRVTLQIYTLGGQLVTTLTDGNLAIGATTFFWNGTSSTGSVVPSGVYLLRAVGPKLATFSKIIVIK